MTAAEAARQYIAAGLPPLPVPYRQKKPVVEGWPKLRLTADDVPKYFNGNDHPQNIGLLLGDDSGTTDADLDCMEAVRAAPFLLPETRMKFGHASKPVSHWFYRMDPPHTSLAYKDTDGKMILELRCQAKDGSVGMQTVVPPSTHELGEEIRFEPGCGPNPANVDSDVLLAAVARTAAAALLARHWPARGQGRHACMLGLAGALARAGWTKEETKIFARAVYHALTDPDRRALGRSDDEVESSFRRMAEEKEFTGWPHVIVGEHVAKLAISWLGLRSEPSPPQVETGARQRHEPQFTGNLAPWPAPMSQEAFHGIAGKFVEMVLPHTEADSAFLLLDLLTYAGNVLGRRAYVMAGGDEHYTNLYTCAVGPTSAGRKGSADAPVRMFFTAGDRAPGLGNMLPSLSSGEGLIWTIRDPVWGKRYDPKTRKTEEVLLHEGVDDKRLLVTSGEFMGVLQVMRRQGNTLSPVVRAAWESGYLVSPTKNSPAKATGAHVSIIGAISKEELLRAVEEVDADNGLLNRFLWCCSRRSKALPEGGQLWQVVESPEWRALQENFNRIAPREPRRMARDEEAADIWGRDSHPDRGLYAELSRERYGLAGAATARAHAQVLRLSLLYAVLDGREAIGRQHLDAAAAVWKYCEASARYVFGDALGDPTADAIIKALRAAATGLTRTDIRDHFRRNKQEGEITRALYLLHQKGLARFERQETGGRPIERWFATSGGGTTTKGG
jgi:hypothetical protein